MKILHVCIGYLPAVGWGGPVSVVAETAGEQTRRGHAVTVCATNLASKSERVTPGTAEATIDGVRVVYLGTWAIARWPGTVGPMMLSPRALARLAREVRAADVVHVHGTRNVLCVTAAHLARVYGKPLVLQPHGTTPARVGSVRLKKLADPLLVRPLLRRASAIIALTPQEAATIESHGAPRERMHRISNGTRRQDPAATQAAAAADPRRPLTILFLGRVHRKKGPDILVEAYARIPEPWRSRSNVVIGGPDDGALESTRALAQERGVADRVRFTGLLDRAQVRSTIADADVFVLPSREENYPMVLVEACAAGRAAVVSSGCEIAPLVASAGGIVVDPEPDAFAGAIAGLLADDALRARVGERMRELAAKEFDIASTTDRMDALYAGLLA